MLEHLRPAVLKVLDIAQNAVAPAQEALQPCLALVQLAPPPILAIQHQQVKGEDARGAPSAPHQEPEQTGSPDQV